MYNHTSFLVFSCHCLSFPVFSAKRSSTSSPLWRLFFVIHPRSFRQQLKSKNMNFKTNHLLTRWHNITSSHSRFSILMWAPQPYMCVNTEFFKHDELMGNWGNDKISILIITSTVVRRLHYLISLVLYQLKDYTNTLENNFSSASTWSIKYYRCRQKIHRHLEMPKIYSIVSCHPQGITTYLLGTFERP